MQRITSPCLVRLDRAGLVNHAQRRISMEDHGSHIVEVSCDSQAFLGLAHSPGGIHLPYPYLNKTTTHERQWMNNTFLVVSY